MHSVNMYPPIQWHTKPFNFPKKFSVLHLSTTSLLPKLCLPLISLLTLYLCIFQMSYKCNNRECNICSLVFPLSIMHLRFMCAFSWFDLIFHCFFRWILLHYSNVLWFIYSFIGGYLLGSLFFFPVIKQVAINCLMQVFVQT